MLPLLEQYLPSHLLASIKEALAEPKARLHLAGTTGSLASVIGAAIAESNTTCSQLFIAPDKESACYLANDLESLLGEASATNIDEKRVLLFPSGDDHRPTDRGNADRLMRSDVVRQLASDRPLLVVAYPEALAEKVASARAIASNTLTIHEHDSLSPDFIIDVLQEYGFERADFVTEPGQYALRGGIIDLFSWSNDNPYRIEFLDDEVLTLRCFDAATQLSLQTTNEIAVMPDMKSIEADSAETVSLLNYFDGSDIIWTHGLTHTADNIDNDLLSQLLDCKIIETGSSSFFKKSLKIEVGSEPQPAFNKRFDLLCSTLNEYMERQYRCYICVDSDQQRRRLEKIFKAQGDAQSRQVLPFHGDDVQLMEANLANGFIDHDNKVLCFTDHEIFERYHKYTVRDLSKGRKAMTLKELFELHPGDYVTHIDYGVGRFSGLEKIKTPGGKTQEVIRLIYKNNDTLYISIHGLHKISRYIGKDGVEPTLNRLGSNTWQVLKQKTKSHVKDIAKDLIALYAKRKATKGFAFSGDTYLQHELEASFIYEDTPDQLKATMEVKADMEQPAPMDRLVCGDVGFGKTEVAIRAAFKAVADSKQVAVLVPATILALQHYNTFTERLQGMPVRVEYLNRFRSAKDRTRIFKEVEEGKIDILIGTHAITNSKLRFKDLGLLIIDEEQKFGVAIKEKLRQMKVNVDCLTLTATPIPRTLQFSLMGARDLSVIQTPPPNRQPIQTEVLTFDEEVIADAIRFEMSRGGQTFFISNRVENLAEMAGLVNRLVPDAVTAIAHGQMEGRQVEDTLIKFINGDIDVLVATTIIENGLDIPNVNTMIINNAQNFGLADLHQMRGRVGRSNRKAFCYMMVPSHSILTPEAQKRLRAIEEFTSIGSGFNIAMRDLDIRGAGNILGAEQSGFISEIGYDMYQKILNEALEELRETTFGDLFPHSEERPYVRECTIETDLEVLIPDSYVTNISERLQLYKELNDLNEEAELDAYRERLIDRFGPLPLPTQELIQTITLRRLCKAFGVERVIIKEDRETQRERTVLFFAAGEDNAFYQSSNFGRVIAWAQAHPRTSRLKENNGRLTLSTTEAATIPQAVELLRELKGE